MGGAEMMLYNLLSHIDRQEFQPNVISLGEGGVVDQMIRDLGIPIEGLDLGTGFSSIVGSVRLIKLLRSQSPDLVQTWMYHADFLAGLAVRLSTRLPVIWGVHSGSPIRDKHKKTTSLVIKACSLLASVVPKKIIVCSQSSADKHVGIGYPEEKLVYIGNGFDIERFHHDARAGQTLRTGIGVDQSAPVVGMVARFHPVKGHQFFIDIAKKIKHLQPDAHFLLCGDQIDQANARLSQWIESARLGGFVHLLGQRSDMRAVYSAMNVAVLCSTSEAFPMVVGESMACETPCVVSDVGDAALIAGDPRLICSDRLVSMFSEKIGQLLDMEKSDLEVLRRSCRRRVVEHFSLDKVARRYEQVYRDVSGLKPAASDAAT